MFHSHCVPVCISFVANVSIVVTKEERQFVILTEEDVSILLPILLPLKGRDTVSFSLFISVYQFFLAMSVLLSRRRAYQFCCQCKFCC